MTLDLLLDVLPTLDLLLGALVLPTSDLLLDLDALSSTLPTLITKINCHETYQTDENN